MSTITYKKGFSESDGHFSSKAQEMAQYPCDWGILLSCGSLVPTNITKREMAPTEEKMASLTRVRWLIVSSDRWENKNQVPGLN